jgi:lipopolysaccharide biosynthesis glycosyltransferase
MKAALVTLAIGLPPAACPGLPGFAAYARRHGMDFLPITQAVYHLRPNWLVKRRVGVHCEKFQLFDLLARYERILFLDSDILLNPSCPNLLDIVPASHFGWAVDDARAQALIKRQTEMQRIERKLGRLPPQARPYYNSGVMVMSACHQPLFAMAPREFVAGRWPEQTLLNYRVARAGIAIHTLPPAFNFMPFQPDWSNPAARRSAHVIHYAGPDAKQMIYADAASAA